ncbi:AI-2E family transporter [Dongia rigui]|uniref:AI-2E family transporter n=1 Tax=Dongia rigui TaxID=940149 RepID=A0ABU5DWI9_9PROT|nr:AI-2E family transporter [Dongia rigui]MDY0870946.1 AI-2E family transporter [Dongia rigui]
MQRDTIPANAPLVVSSESEPEARRANTQAGAVLFLAVIAGLVALYFAQSVVLPVIIAFVLRLLLQPVFKIGLKARLPRSVAAVLTILFLLGVAVLAWIPLSGSAGLWIAKLPDAIATLTERLSLLHEPIDFIQRLVRHAERATNGGSNTVAVQHFDLVGTVIEGLRAITDGLFTTTIILFFLLVAGDKFLRRLVELLPTFRQKRQLIEISQQIEDDISAYLVTISIMNVAVGVMVAIAMYFCGMADPLLWGVLALAVNFVPILGPLVGIGIFLLVGFITFDNWLAVLPAALYLVIHVIEGEIVTPILLAKRFTLNPVGVILSLVFWYWMWGVPGAILAVPMLAMVKIVSDRIEALHPLGHMLED